MLIEQLLTRWPYREWFDEDKVIEKLILFRLLAFFSGYKQQAERLCFMLMDCLDFYE